MKEFVMKEFYEDIEIELIVFTEEDVVITSGGSSEGSGRIG